MVANMSYGACVAIAIITAALAIVLERKFAKQNNENSEKDKISTLTDKRGSEGMGV